MDQSVLPLDPLLLEVPSGVPKMISEPIARSAQIVHLSCTEINNLQMDQNELLFDPSQVSSIGSAKNNF
jgi:hypothetical protein